MSKRIFTEEQLRILRSNTNVATCSERSISYHPDFKLRAVKQYQDEGLSAREIFHLAGLSWNLVGPDIPTECIKRWKRRYREKGLPGLQIKRSSGKREKPKELPEKDKIKYLEAQVSYLKAENAFLAKLRAKRKAESNLGQSKNSN